MVAKFDWHASVITRDTPVTPDYRTTQNVRRFLAAQVGSDVRLDHQFMAWIRTDAPETMGALADELKRRR